MTTTLKLRDYQTESIQAFHSSIQQGLRRPAIVLPTGMGKTVILSATVDSWISDPNRSGAALILVHRTELADQTVAKLLGHNPELRVGVVKAARDEHRDVDVIVASVQTIGQPNGRRLAALLESVTIGLIIVDECHHAAADSYMRVLTAVGAFKPTGAVALGFTATMGRSDSKGLGQVWQEVIYKKPIEWAIARGYLVNVTGIQVLIEDMDMGEVERRGGDYTDRSLGEALEESGALDQVAIKYLEHARREVPADAPEGTVGELRRGIAFWPTIAVAEQATEIFRTHGIPCELVIGETADEDRALVYKRTRSGDNKVIHSVGVLTEGFDLPEAEVCVVGRPTTHQGLYVQMVGRVLRPSPWTGKVDALVLDVAGVASKLPLATMSELTEGRIAVKDGESLEEAIERTASEDAAAAELAAQIKLRGRVTSQQIDLFHSSASAWLTTTGGVWFIPTRTGTYFLLPDGDEGLWKIGKAGKYSLKGQGSRGWLRGGLDMETARAIAEQWAEADDPTVSQRTAPWRKSKTLNEPQMALANRLGLTIPEGIRKGELSDMISIHYASTMLDPIKDSMSGRMVSAR